jgi:hypothetical protein
LTVSNSGRVDQRVTVVALHGPNHIEEREESRGLAREIEGFEEPRNVQRHGGVYQFA